MRRLVVAALMFGVVQSADAADMPDLPFLRGSQDIVMAPRPVWQGYYVGGQAGYGTADMNFSGATRDLAGRLLALTTIENEFQVSQWPVNGRTSQRGNGFGLFAGYNSQWDDVVIGVEFSYLHGKFGGSQTGSLGRSFTTSDGYTNGVTYDSTASIAISDIGTLRGRAGYAFGNFLPYMFAGLALGQADVSRTAHIYGTQVNQNAAPGFQNISFDDSLSDVRHGRLLIGYSAGLGVDVMLAAGLFLRAEWEYLRFASPIDVSINTGRVGLGYKF